MKSACARTWPYLQAALRCPLRVPFTRWSVPVGAIVVGAVVLAGGTGIAIRETEKPLFCISCHEMGMPVRTWRASSHKDVGCEKCHIMPGRLNMFKSKVKSLRQVYLHARGDVKASAIQAHVPDRNCKECHPQTRDLVVYHSLKITHRAHWDRGIECTFCHDRVVHGPQAPYKNTPRMATCFKCHDGKKAPNTCSTCHVTLGERRPSTFRPEWVEAHKEDVREHKNTCKRCHQADFCDNCHRSASPHPSDWLRQHPAGFRKSPASCRTCHAAPTEQGEMVFCANCHALKRAHGLQWIGTHPDAFRRDPKDCSRCHEQHFCSDCHAIYQQHPENWTYLHPAQAQANPKGCRVCHTQEFCQRCHTKTEPKSHTAQWPQAHGAAVKAGASCTLCHTPRFCQACHLSKAGKPGSHDARWTTAHGAASQAEPSTCKACHDESFCTSCHGLKVPHAKGWPQAHQAAAKRDAKVCQRCHDQSYCAACHRGTLPESHQKDWVQRHGAQAKADRKACLNCHTTNLCQACHRGVTMPHPRDWLKTHGAQAKTPQGRQPCGACHDPATCTKCHGVEVPHPQDWMLTHKAKASFAANAVCFKCHQRSYCAQCHGEQAQPAGGK